MILPALHVSDYKTLVKVLVWGVYSGRDIKDRQKTWSRYHFSILKHGIVSFSYTLFVHHTCEK